jgi:hypothetical protein
MGRVDVVGLMRFDVRKRKERGTVSQQAEVLSTPDERSDYQVRKSQVREVCSLS